MAKTLEENIQKWVVLDNNQRKINEQIKEIRNKKNELSNNILHHFSSNNMKVPTINISDGKLNFIEVKQANVLSYKFLEDCFNEYFSDDYKTRELLDFIKNKRTYTNAQSIKRLYNKP